METLANELGIERERRLYGYGSQLVARPSESDLTRDRVGAVYKLSATADRAVMKFTVPVEDGFSPAGKTMVVQFGSVVRSVALNGKGKNADRKQATKVSVSTRKKRGNVAAQDARVTVTF